MLDHIDGPRHGLRQPRGKESPGLGEYSEPRTVIVSNRGPRDFVWQKDLWVAKPAAGGLVSMLMPLAAQANVSWFCCVSEPPDAKHAQHGLFTTAADQADPLLHVVPIPLPAEMYHAYYGQISNEVLWMLQHRVIGPSGFGQLDHDRQDAWERGYLAANEQMAKVIKASCFNVRAFLIQDYHLYPLPALLRASFPDTPIVHFTHIPFPDPSLMRLLPAGWRAEILNGMLGADVVGLQTETDVEAFIACCRSFLNAIVDRAAGTVVSVDGRRVIVRAYPASVDPEELARCMASPKVARARERVVPRMGEMRVIRVDRLDPSKNQLIGFRAFGRLLDLRPDLRSRVRFSAFLVPSRTDLSIYRAYRDEIYACIAEINERYPRPDGTPVIDVFYTNNREQALAAMEECDALLVNSLHDGMNLVAKEWALISRRPGVLVVSETAGVAEEMSDAALLVSPLDLDGTARALARALDMPEIERRARLDTMRRRVQSWTASDWLSAQLADLGVVASSLTPAR